MPDISNDALLNFVNESCRSAGDKLAGLLTFPGSVINACIGQGFPAVLGTDPTKLTQTAAWTDADYADVLTRVNGNIIGSDSGGRTLLANTDVIALLRAIVVLNQMIAANDQLQPLVYKFAVNPRA